MNIYTLFLILAGGPLLGFIISLILIWAARRGRSLEDTDWQTDESDRRLENSRLILLYAYSGTKVLYGVVQAFYLGFYSGAFGSAERPLELGISLPVFCALCAGVNFVTAVADGLLGASAVRGRRLMTMEGFRGAFIQLCVVEFLAILGLLFSFLAMIY